AGDLTVASTRHTGPAAHDEVARGERSAGGRGEGHRVGTGSEVDARNDELRVVDRGAGLGVNNLADLEGTSISDSDRCSGVGCSGHRDGTVARPVELAVHVLLDVVLQAVHLVVERLGE